MNDLGRAVTIALAIFRGIALCVLFFVFIVNLHDLFERVDRLEEEEAKNSLAIRGMLKNGSAD